MRGGDTAGKCAFGTDLASLTPCDIHQNILKIQTKLPNQCTVSVLQNAVQERVIPSHSDLAKSNILHTSIAAKVI